MDGTSNPNPGGSDIGLPDRVNVAVAVSEVLGLGLGLLCFWSRGLAVRSCGQVENGMGLCV